MLILKLQGLPATFQNKPARIIGARSISSASPLAMYELPMKRRTPTQAGRHVMGFDG